MTARMAGLRPGTSPPPVRFTIVPLWLMDSLAHVGHALRRRAQRPPYPLACTEFSVRISDPKSHVRAFALLAGTSILRPGHSSADEGTAVMSWLLVWLGVLLGFAAARGLDADWVLFWYVGRRELDLSLQVAADAVELTVAGVAAGVLGRWLAGWTARGVGMGIGVPLLAATAMDLVLGMANAPWWHELLTALVMVPAAAWGGGLRLR